MAERTTKATGQGQRPRRGGAAPPPSTQRPAAPEGDGLGAVAAAVPDQHPVCSVAFCPICMVVTALGDARPELVEHLLVASREMLLAVRAVIDARLDTMEEQPKAGLQRIRIE